MLGGVVVNRIGPAAALVDAAVAFRSTLRQGGSNQLNQLVGCDERAVRRIGDVSKHERVVADLSQHPPFVRCEHAAVVVVDQRPQTNPGGAAQVNIARRPIRQHPRQNKCSIELDKGCSAAIEIEDVAEAVPIEVKSPVRIVLLNLLRLDREAVRREGAQEDATEPEGQILIDDLFGTTQAAFGRGH